MIELKNLIDIVRQSDAMIARGDLLVEISYFGLEMLGVEKYIASCCDLFSKDCIIATRIADLLETDMNMTSEKIGVLFVDVFMCRKDPIFLLSGEILMFEGKAIKNLDVVLNNIKLISDMRSLFL